MIYSYDVRVGGDVCSITFEADSDSSPLGNVSGSGASSSLETLMKMAGISSTPAEFEENLSYNRSCSIIKDDAPAPSPPPAPSRGMSWGSSLDNDDDEDE